MESRRVFLKNSALGIFALSNAGMLFGANETLPKKCSYFIRDLRCGGNLPVIKADKILEINGDIAEIYGELKTAFESGAIIGSVSGEAAFFVFSQMARDYGFRVVFNEKQGENRAWILAPKGVKI